MTWFLPTGRHARIIISGLKQSDSVYALQMGKRHNAVWDEATNCFIISPITEYGFWVLYTNDKQTNILVDMATDYTIEVAE